MNVVEHIGSKNEVDKLYLREGQFDGVFPEQELLATGQDGGKVLGVVPGEAEHHGEVGPARSLPVCLHHLPQHVPQETQTHVLVHQSSQHQLTAGRTQITRGESFVYYSTV